MNYWERRQTERYKAGEKLINQYYRDLEVAFQRARRSVQNVIDGFYGRYADANGVSLTEARKRLGKAEIGDLEDFIDRVNATMGKYDLELENMSIKARITRYEALEKQIDAILQQVYAMDYEYNGGLQLNQVYQDSYYRTWYASDVYEGFHAEFAQIEPRTVDALVNYPFNGANFSSRLWKQKDYLQQQLMQDLTVMMIQGKHPRTLAPGFAKHFKQRSFDAYRLLHTEFSFVTEQASQDAYKQDGVEEYEYIATLDSRTCGVCGPMDGKIVPIGRGRVGIDLPPLHPLCRCTTAPHYPDTPMEGRTRIARNAEGKNVKVPADMTYEEWKKKFIEKTSTSDTIESGNAKEVPNVHIIGKIDRDLYKCITEDIVTDEVIITDERIGHIKERHPNDYEQYYGYLKNIIENPDYIIEANKPNTALILKEIKESEEKQFKTVLRLTTSTDNPDFKNSIITFMKISEKEWSRLLRNKRILYKKE